MYCTFSDCLVRLLTYNLVPGIISDLAKVIFLPDPAARVFTTPYG